MTNAQITLSFESDLKRLTRDEIYELRGQLRSTASFAEEAGVEFTDAVEHVAFSVC